MAARVAAELVEGGGQGGGGAAGAGEGEVEAFAEDLGGRHVFGVGGGELEVGFQAAGVG